jgi:hypothetical protein
METVDFVLGGDVTVTDNILVTGQRGQLLGALIRQRSDVGRCDRPSA